MAGNRTSEFLTLVYLILIKNQRIKVKHNESI